MESATAQSANLTLPIWKRLLHNTTVTIGCNNVFGQDPPDAGTSVKYADLSTSRPAASFTSPNEEVLIWPRAWN